MAIEIILLVVGVSLLVGGGEMVVRGATSLARGLGVSPLAIGLTIVAFGTSAPELAVNLSAALQDRGAICFGNIIGSNMANIGLIISITALIRPIHIRGVIVAREIPMMLLATAAAIVMGFDEFLGGGPNLWDRGDAIILLMLFLVFLYYTVGEFVGAQRTEASPAERSEDASATRRGLLITAAGLAALVGGSNVTIDAAVTIAQVFGVSDVVIGMTVLAIGTSLPELVAALVASFRGAVELAVGNVIGSNIFNLLLVGGFTSMVRPIPVPEGGGLDLLVMGVLSLLLMFVSLTYRRNIVRTEACGLLVIYLGYVFWRSFDAISA